MATGRYTHSKGHRTQEHLIQSWESNLFGLLHDSGYYVAFFGKNFLLSEESLQKVDHWDADASATNDTSILSFITNHKSDKTPWIMFISTAGAAPPYSGSGGKDPAFGQPGYYSYYNNGASIYDPKEVALKAPLRAAQPASSKKPSYHEKIRKNRQLENLSTADDSDYFYKLNAVYLESITTKVDGLLGKILDALEADPTLDNNTAVIATSEAGDYAGDYGLVKSWAGGLDDVLTRVPFVARIPGGAKGHVVKEPIQVFDVFPTILEIAGASGASKLRNTYFAQSLVPQLMGAAGDPERVVYAEAGFLYPTELEPVHSGGPEMVGASDPQSMEYPTVSKLLPLVAVNPLLPLVV
jgi:choline-sulfatase